MTYTVPIRISQNAMVRAFAYTDGMIDSKIKTHSYIFPEQVIRQKNTMLQDYGFDYSAEETGRVFWTEEMDPNIVDAAEYRVDVLEGLTDIPTMSVVMPKGDLWGENGIHWGKNLANTTDAFERECSVEMIYPENYKGKDLESWQENTGIKIQGGGGRWDMGTYDHKQSFTLAFKDVYGAGKLRNELFADAPHGRETAVGKYDRIILRSGHNKGWGTTWDREKTVYTRDQLGRDLQLLMSGFGSHGTFVHLYLNGKYWGLYNPCVRPDEDYLANQFGGASENYFYAKGKDSKASDDRLGEPGQSKTRFYEACAKDYKNMPFDEMRNWVMMDQSIACFLVYGYANPGDGPQYYYGNNNNPAGPVVWTPWDIEDSFGGGSRRTGSPSVTNMLDDRASGDNGLKAFWTNPDFKMYFNDVVYKHFFNKGVMTDEHVMVAWDKLTNTIFKAIVCESARWGDERGATMDRDHEWNAARLAVRSDLKGRGNDFITKLKASGYYSSVAAPKIGLADVEVDTGFLYLSEAKTLKIAKVGSGEVYYTLDGSDPRTWDLTGSVSAKAIRIEGSDALLDLRHETTIKARTKIGSEWSPLRQLVVYADLPAGIDDWSVEKNPGAFDPASGMYLFASERMYTVYNASGRLMLKGKGKAFSLQGMPVGLYIVKTNRESFKVIK